MQPRAQALGVGIRMEPTPRGERNLSAMDIHHQGRPKQLGRVPSRMILQTTKWSALSLAVTIALTVAAMAAAYRAYDGPARPRQQIAVLHMKGLVVDTIDGKSATDTHCDKDLFHTQGNPKHCHLRMFFNPIELLPGDHTIVFAPSSFPSWTAGPASGTPETKLIHVDAGKTYQARFRWEGRYYNDPHQGPVAHWWVEIAEH